MSLKTRFASSLLKINTLGKTTFANQFILSIDDNFGFKDSLS